MNLKNVGFVRLGGRQTATMLKYTADSAKSVFFHVPDPFYLHPTLHLTPHPPAEADGAATSTRAL